MSFSSYSNLSVEEQEKIIDEIFEKVPNNNRIKKDFTLFPWG